MSQYDRGSNCGTFSENLPNCTLIFRRPLGAGDWTQANTPELACDRS